MEMEMAHVQRLLPPPGVHPNNAIFGAVQLPRPLSWQQREHLAQRRHILARIGQLLDRNAQLVASSQGAAPLGLLPSSTLNDPKSKTWALARKLEVLLFLQSASLLEYSNVDSLARRVQALTASIVNRKIRKDVVNPSASSTSTPRMNAPRPCANDAMYAGNGSVMGGDVNPYATATATVTATALPYVSAPMTGKRRAGNEFLMPSNAMEPLMETKKRCLKRPSQSSELTLLLFRGYDEISKMIWGFVDGVHIMRCRAVSRSARALLPLFVSSLQLSCNSIQRALNTRVAGNRSILMECVNLRQLDVDSLSSGMTFGKLSMRANNCPQRFVVTHDDHEQIVMALSEHLRVNSFPSLERLALTCLFTNEEADGEADVLLNNLMFGCCPQLEELCLPGNSFGDYGASKVAQMLQARVCPKLTRLDLRRNFIGEEGIHRLCRALAEGCAPELTELCLGGNTITDSSFHHILFALDSGHLQKLRFLGIEMNYLTASSFELLGRTIGRMVCPLLSQISYSDNSVDNGEAKRVIATAVYHERMRRVHSLQQKHQHDDLRHYQPRRVFAEAGTAESSSDEHGDYGAESDYSSTGI